MKLPDDVRAVLANRIASFHGRIVNGPKIKGLPEGYVAVPEDVLASLTETFDEDSEDEPVDPQEMRIRNLSISQLFNDGVEPAVIHAGSVRKSLIGEGFSEETAEHLAGNIFIMAAQGIMGVDDDSLYE